MFYSGELPIVRSWSQSVSQVEVTSRDLPLASCHGEVKLFSGHFDSHLIIIGCIPGDRTLYTIGHNLWLSPVGFMVFTVF